MRDTIEVDKISMSKEECAFWQREMESSIQFQRKMFNDRINYYQLVAYYEGIQIPGLSYNPSDQYGFSTTERYSLSTVAIINEMFPAIYSVINATYNQNPTVSVKAKHPKAEKNVNPLAQFLSSPASSNYEPYPLTALMEGALKFAMKKTGMKEENQMALFDMLVAGFAIVEVNHRVETVRKAGKEPVIDERTIIDKGVDKVIDIIEGAAKSLNPGSLIGKTNEEIAEKVISTTEKLEEDVRVDATYVKRWDPTKILFDYRADIFKESRYIAKIVDMTVAEFQDRYPNFKDQVPENSLRDLSFSRHKEDINSKSVRLYEIEIKRPDQNRILVIAPGIQEALDYYEKPVTTNDFSLKYGCVDKYGKIYPMSRARQMKKAQDDLNHYATIQMEHADRQMQKIAYWKEGLTDSGEKALRDNDIYGLVEKKNPGAVFEAVPQGGVTPENKDLQRMMVESINKIGATNELAKSGQSDSEFATQDAIKQQSFNVSISGYQDALEDLVGQEVDAIKDIIMQLWDGDDYFQITGLPGGDQWYQPEMGPLSDLLIGDYLTEVDIMTAERPNPMKNRAEAAELFTLLTNPATRQFLMEKGKDINVQAVENLIKQYGQNPDTILTDIQGANIAGLQGLPPEQLPNPNMNIAGAEQPVAPPI